MARVQNTPMVFFSIPAPASTVSEASEMMLPTTGTTLEISGGKMGVQNPAKAWKDKETRA